MTEEKCMKTIIETGFQKAFSLRMPGGAIRRFPCCDWHDDHSYAVIVDGERFVLVHEDSRDNGFKELGREALPEGTQATYGYHDDEHGEFRPLGELETEAA